MSSFKVLENEDWRRRHHPLGWTSKKPESSLTLPSLLPIHIMLVSFFLTIPQTSSFFSASRVFPVSSMCPSHPQTLPLVTRRGGVLKGSRRGRQRLRLHLRSESYRSWVGTGSLRNQLCYSLPIFLWTRNFCPCMFPFCRTGKRTLTTSWDCCANEWVNICEAGVGVWPGS